MTRVVINDEHGGFSLSAEAAALLLARGLEVAADGYDYRGRRDDPALVDVVETLGARANGEFARLVVVEVPDDVAWHVSVSEGRETIHENHRSWGPAARNGTCPA